MPSVVEPAETSVENVCEASRDSNLGVLDPGEKPCIHQGHSGCGRKKKMKCFPSWEEKDQVRECV